MEFFFVAPIRRGVFSRNYLIALFPDLSGAALAERSLCSAGFPRDEVVAVPGDDVVNFTKEHAEHSGLGTLLMQALSRMFETEEVYADHDVKLASRGAGFLAVHAPDDAKKHAAWAIIQPLEPIVARHYTNLGVEHLKGET